MLIIGDSISTDYYGNYPKWVTHLIETGYFPEDTVNDSIHATGFVRKAVDGNGGLMGENFVNRIQKIKNPEQYDLVVVFGGINDYRATITGRQDIQLGTVDGDYTQEFIPAVNWFFNYATEHFVNAKIVVIQPLLCNVGSGVDKADKIREYSYALADIAEEYDIPVLNLTDNSGFNPFDAEFKNTWTLKVQDGERLVADGIHPNEDYQKQHLAPMIRQFLDGFLDEMN